MSNTSLSGAEKKRVLGRGLGSLFGDTDTSRAVTAPVAPAAPTAEKGLSYKMIAIEKIFPNPLQPRKQFAEEKLAELSLSIKAHGILQPILVSSEKEGEYQIIAGERRWRASQLAGLKEVPVIIKPVNESKNLELAIIENIQRQDLNPVEEARAYLQLIKKFGHTQNELAEKVGKDRATIANALRILTLDPQVLELVTHGQLSVGHAKVLLGVENKIKQRALAKKVSLEGLSVRALEKMTSRTTQADTQPGQASSAVGADQQQCELFAGQLEKRLGTKTKIDYLNGRGHITISFYSKDQLCELAERLKNI